MRTSPEERESMLREENRRLREQLATFRAGLEYIADTEWGDASHSVNGPNDHALAVLASNPATEPHVREHFFDDLDGDLTKYGETRSSPARELAPSEPRDNESGGSLVETPVPASEPPAPDPRLIVTKNADGAVVSNQDSEQEGS